MMTTSGSFVISSRPPINSSRRFISRSISRRSFLVYLLTSAPEARSLRNCLRCSTRLAMILKFVIAPPTQRVVTYGTLNFFARAVTLISAPGSVPTSNMRPLFRTRSLMNAAAASIISSVFWRLMISIPPRLANTNGRILGFVLLFLRP